MAINNIEFFFIAAREGNIQQLRYYLNSGVDIHVGNDLALRLATENGQIETVKFLLQNGANIQVLDDLLLRLASLKGKTETVEKILEYGSCSHEAKIYAIYNAILYGYIDIVKLLLQNGVSPSDNEGAILKVLQMCKYDNIRALFDVYLNWIANSALVFLMRCFLYIFINIFSEYNISSY